MQSPIPFFYLLLIVVFQDSHRRHVVKGQPTCSKNCKPFCVVHCDQTTSECSEGCNLGYYGLTCNKTCQCDGGGCNVHSGQCVPKSTKDKSSQKTAEATKGCVPVQCHCNSIVIPLAVFLALSLCAAVGLAIFVVYIYRQKIPHPSEENEQKEQRIPLTNPYPKHNKESRLDVTASNTNLLVYELGVHCLQPNAEGGEPIILQCVHLKYDFRKINIDRTRETRDGILVNEPDTEGEEFEGRFKTFHGTTTTHPTLQMDCPMYWEVFNSVKLTNPLQPTDLLLCIGLCREEDRDVRYQTPLKPNCYNLNVGPCGKHSGICAKIYRYKTIEVDYEETNIKNTAEQTGKLKYGILVKKGREEEKGTIAYFDLNHTKLMCLLENVDFTRPLWPVFGVYGRSGPHVTMQLNTGRDIDMTPEKKDMIRDALIKTAG